MLDRGRDQAFGLRQLFGTRSLRVLPVASGENDRRTAGFVINMAAALARAGCKPLIIDGQGDSLARNLGFEPKYELEHLLRGERSFASVAMKSTEGFSVLCARRGLSRIAKDPSRAEAVFCAIASLRDSYDIALLHAGEKEFGDILADFEPETAVLCGPGEEALTTTYARLKSLVRTHGASRFRVVFDQAAGTHEAADRHRRLASVAERYLSVVVEYGGALLTDVESRTALRARSSVFGVAAQGGTARAFERIADSARHWRLPAFEATAAAIH